MKDIKILSIGSEDYNFSKIEKILKIASYNLELVHCPDLSDLKIKIQKDSWDLILTEIQLTDFTYKDVIDLIKEKNPEISIVLFSNQINLNIAIESIRLGVNDYLKKEIPDRIIAVIAREIREAESRSARKMAEEAVFYMAYHDPLTGLANRYSFENKLIKILEEKKLNPDLNHCILYLDLDQFKIVNDTCGHQAGDDLLRLVSVALNQVVKKEGFAARIGGDEFVIILENSDLMRSKEFANSLLKKISEIRFHFHEKVFSIGGSIGLLQIEETHSDINEILSLVDVACYSAKESGRNRIHISNSEDTIGSIRIAEMRWLNVLITSLEKNQFTLYKQPIVSVPYSGDSIIFYEFLLRLRDDHKNLIMPDVFMRAAERYDMMPSLDRWVVNHAFAYIAKNTENLKKLKNKSCFFINLSGASLNDETFFDFVDKKFLEYSIEPSLICFEITETVAISDLKKSNRFIQEIRKKGFYFALDDFGSGMSSFSYLKNLPVDFLKIDGSFIRDMTLNSLDYTIVESMHKIASSIGLRTVAEFVENLETLKLLEKIGINFAQGYAIAYPTAID
jgi:diguanylate cyclase (GGDEF)-like protein